MGKEGRRDMNCLLLAIRLYGVRTLHLRFGSHKARKLVCVTDEN